MSGHLLCWNSEHCMTSSTYWIKLGFVAVILALVSAIGVSLRYETHWAAAQDDHRAAMTAFIRAQAQSTGMIEEDFSTTSAERHAEVFSAYFARIQSPEIIRIKVWNKEHTIIWSNLTETIGQQFADNHELDEAFEGEVEMEIEKEKEEHVSERHYDEFAEIYVPVYGAEDSRTVIGVIEVYQPSIMMRDAAGEKRMKDVGVAAAVSLTILGVLGLAFRPKEETPSPGVTA